MGAVSEYDLLASLLRDRAGVDIAQYKPEQMRRRLQNAMSRMGVTSVSDLLRRARQDQSVIQDLVDRVTVNVSEFFRNPEAFEVLERLVLPGLLKRFGRLRIWSAGCSYGAEPYSVAILLCELDPAGSHAICGTDIDRTILARAAEAIFTAADLKNVSPSRLMRFFEHRGTDWQVTPAARRRVTFRRHNLLSDPFERGWHLIACRNVVIYFTEDAKQALYRRFFDALVPGGYLFLGATEQILNAAALGFETPRPCFYRKPAAHAS